MANILIKGKIFGTSAFECEEELENAAIANKEHIFGTESVLLSHKRKLGLKGAKNRGIPDGFLIDFSNSQSPQLFFVEYELESHDLYEHIGPQIMCFYASFETAKIELQKKLLRVIKDDKSLKSAISSKLSDTPFDNVDSLFSFLIHDNNIGVIVVIDEQTEDFNSLLRRFSDVPEVIVMKKYQLKDDVIYQYLPFREGIVDVDSKRNKQKKAYETKEIDTIVCPARKEGFKHAFLNSNAWWAIRISPSLISQLKYIAMYETCPISQIRWFAKIKQNGIQPYKNTGKYIINIEGKKKIKPIKLDKGKKGVAPQSPRYTTYDKLIAAGKISELW